MLQTELKPNTSNSATVNNVVPKNEKQANIAKRLEELNKWQEQQKKLLEDRQIKQRQMLGMEQQTMYEMLGIQTVSDMTLLEEDQKPNELETEGLEQMEYCTEESAEESLETSQLEEETEVEDGELNNKQSASYRTLSSVYDAENCIGLPGKSVKKSFLKRGEGIKQRFKIDPEDLRLNNLPKYKYANAHPNLRLKPLNKLNKLTDLNAKVTKPVIFPNTNSKKEDLITNLDAQEQRFQNLLITSKNTCNSTPDTKSSFVASKTTLKNTYNSAEKAIFETSKSNETSDKPVVWSKILDPLEIKPLQVPRSTKQILPQTEESIFELLEQKAQEGSFDMDSTCLKDFMTRRITEKLNECEDIPVKEQVRNKRLEPVVINERPQEPTFCSSEDGDEESQATDEGQTTDSDETTHKTIETTNSPQSQHVAQVRVRFSDSNETHEYEEDPVTTVDETNRLSAGTLQQEGQGDTSKNDLFTQFKQVLFAALQVKADQHLANDSTHNSISDTTLTASPSNNYNNSIILSPACKELQEKTAMIKMRLIELEKEIQTFKDNNIILLKAKQEHELQKSINAQNHLEAMESLNDEKIRMEIILHDERVKLEDEKRQFEQNVKIKTQGLISKERKENERLKEQVHQLEAQLKSKENNHTAAQARLRTQIRNLEREQSKLHEQIETLTRENKRLESEILKIGREQSNKILLEINRNIAKLAPKQIQQSATTMTDHGPPTLGATRTVSKCIVAAATANKNSIKTHKATNTRFSSVPPPTRPEQAETTQDKYFVNEKQQQQQQKHQDCYEDDDDILKEFQTTPEKGNNSNTENLTKGSNQVPLQPPSSPRSGDSMNMKREIVNDDGSKDIWYPNGNLKKISPDGMVIRMLYYNKDIKETNINEGTVKYYYAESNTWHTSYLDGLEILEFPNGQVEHRHKNGVVEVHYPNNSVKIINSKDEQTQEEWRLPDGTHLIQMRNGDKILSLPNGQKEIHNKLHKRREYPDGTVKIVYPDGSAETRYSNGRIRLKDKEGKLVLDTDLAK